jgi:hypothetical protein
MGLWAPIRSRDGIGTHLGPRSPPPKPLVGKTAPEHDGTAVRGALSQKQCIRMARRCLLRHAFFKLPWGSMTNFRAAPLSKSA